MEKGALDLCGEVKKKMCDEVCMHMPYVKAIM